MCRKHGVPHAADQSDKNASAPTGRRSKVRTYGHTPLTGRLKENVVRLEQQLPVLMEQHHVPGVAVSLIFDRQLIWSRGYGVRCAGTSDPVAPDTIMEACSLSKPFFAYMLLKLVEQKQFDLDRPLVEYLESDYLADDPRHRSITARMTLSHTSGLPNWRKGGWRSGSPLSLAFEPGTGFRYSGEGFLMLQRALEKVMESGLGAMSQQRLIQSLKLSNTGFVWDDRFVLRSSCGHDSSGRVKTARRYYGEANAAYSLYTSAEDYARFLVEMLRVDRTADHSLSAATRAEMLTPVSHRDDQDADWGLGWGLRKMDGQQLVYHSGSNGTGFRCYSEFFPETGEGLVIMTNAVGGKELWTSVVEQWHQETP